VETVGTRQWVCFGKWVGKRWNRFFEVMEDCSVGGIPKWLRQSFKLVPDPVWKTKNPVTR
jgi:hypothetical protein